MVKTRLNSSRSSSEAAAAPFWPTFNVWRLRALRGCCPAVPTNPDKVRHLMDHDYLTFNVLAANAMTNHPPSGGGGDGKEAVVDGNSLDFAKVRFTSVKPEDCSPVLRVCLQDLVLRYKLRDLKVTNKGHQSRPSGQTSRGFNSIS